MSNLDAKLRAQMRTEISKLHKRLGTTFIYVTHDQTEAMTMGDRIVVMRMALFSRLIHHLHFERPANKFVAGFLGSPQMNFVELFLFRKRMDILSLNLVQKAQARDIELLFLKLRQRMC